MYSLPINFDLSEFSGATVNQVCYTINTISLLFDGSKYISFEGDYVLIDSKGIEKQMSVYPVINDFGLLKLLEQKIERISANRIDNNLFIVFENKMSLTLIASDNYESYTIKTEDQLIRI